MTHRLIDNTGRLMDKTTLLSLCIWYEVRGYAQTIGIFNKLPELDTEGIIECLEDYVGWISTMIDNQSINKGCPVCGGGKDYTDDVRGLTDIHHLEYCQYTKAYHLIAQLRKD